MENSTPKSTPTDTCIKLKKPEIAEASSNEEEYEEEEPGITMATTTGTITATIDVPYH